MLKDKSNTLVLLLLATLGICSISCKSESRFNHVSNKILIVGDDKPNSKDKTDQKVREIPKEFKDLESEYIDMLEPISSLKLSHPDIYWFIVSWLKTNYRTPDWSNYGAENWRSDAKKRGIDCSGFTRIMLDQMFDREVFGGSQGILNEYTKPIDLDDIEMGDLVFFRAPYSKNDRIVHVGIYLLDDYFVHATSTKSAAKGLGLMINSLQEENWKNELVTAGRVKE